MSARMLDRRLQFYVDTLRECVDRSASVLVVGADVRDKAAFEALGFTDVTLSNLDRAGPRDAFAPYRWEPQDAEQLTHADASFDYVVTHECLHHCRSPHRALLEMVRVARRGALVIEARDSVVMRLLQRLGIASTYELAAVRHHGGARGGVADGPVPNFIYRWTEREVEKTLASYAPEAPPQVRYFYGYDAPAHALRGPAFRVLEVAFRAFTRIFPRQQNLFAFYIAKPGRDRLQPWLVRDGDALRLKPTA